MWIYLPGTILVSPTDENPSLRGLHSSLGTCLLSQTPEHKLLETDLAVGHDLGETVLELIHREAHALLENLVVVGRVQPDQTFSSAGLGFHTVDYDPFIKSAGLRTVKSRGCAVKIWSRYSPEFGETKLSLSTVL